jgi:Flp pilus assembly protein CpaB
MTYRMRNILIAVGLAGFAALLVTFYVSNYKSSVQHQSATVTVPVAAHDIPVSTLGSTVVAKGWLTTREIPRSAVVPGAISSPDQIKSLVATQPTYAGEQITAARFGPIAETGLAGQITGTQRAVQIAGNPNQVLAGILQPGDMVDFAGVNTVHFSGNGTTGVSGSDLTFSRIIVRDLKVIQVQAASTAGKIGGGSGTSTQSAVMLRVTDSQSQKLLLAYAKGDYWTLELRPGIKAQDSANGVETAASLLVDGINRSVINAIFAIAGGK